MRLFKMLYSVTTARIYGVVFFSARRLQGNSGSSCREMNVTESKAAVESIRIVLNNIAHANVTSAPHEAY